MQCTINTRAWMAEETHNKNKNINPFNFCLLNQELNLTVMASFATNWRDLSGENEWEGLLDPLNIDLRRYLLHYGERAQAISDGFIDEEKSKNVGLPRFAKRNFFSKVGLELGNPYKYVVTNYLYAASPKNSVSSLVAYVAVSTDEGSRVLGRRDILISWRGTKLTWEWDIDFETDLVPAPDILGDENNDEAQVHKGWHGYYTAVNPSSPHNEISCRDQVFSLLFFKFSISNF